MPDAPHLPDQLYRQAQRWGERVALRVKQRHMYVDISWRDWHERVTMAARALVSLGVAPGDRVAILSENRLEWLLADLAILSVGAVNVPLHATLGDAQIRYMLVDSGASAIFVSNAHQAAKIHPQETPGLKFLVTMDPANAVPGLTTLTWDGLEQLGRRQPAAPLDERLANLMADDLATIIYTSGTTGLPKGVMLTHANFLANAAAMSRTVGPFTSDTIFFNWLPLSHVHARLVDYYLAVYCGVTLTLAESPDTVLADLPQIRPTHVTSVPRFYEKVLAHIPVADREKKLRAIFGPRIICLGSGGAPLPLAVARAYHDAGLEVIVGYGMTESSPVITTNRIGANKLGTVGQAIPGVEVKVAADGEVLTRGPHVMRGYWNLPKDTAEALADGWLHTGDLGELDAEGYLTITGRKKDLIVLSNGKKVAPTPLEALLATSPFIEQVVIYGEGKPFLSAIIVPRVEALRREVHRHGGEWNDDWTTSHAVHAVLHEELKKSLADAAPWEKVRKFVVAPRSFTIANGELTISMKVRRSVVFEQFRGELERLY